MLLLDGADVFLAKRNNDSIERNAIVSIFLRELEYYSGIMILTTNRLHSFDQAFESRIHFCLEYTELNLDRRLKIWQRFLNNAQRDPKLIVDVTPGHVQELAGLEMNGR